MKNELIHETSPYLLQHAHNPVHWQPWGEEALKAAVAADKPILVSIGYSACHWCHVMERESFENDETAAIMNDYFVNIKIDREERPDLDHIYMDAVQAMIGSGGWPLNVFLTPEGKPFYGGTYFPPQKAFNRASWTDVLHSIHDAWINRRDEMEKQAETLIDHIKNSNSFGRLKNVVLPEEGESPFTKADCETICENLMSRADLKEGGFGAAPKFPQTFSINCLLQGAYFLGDKRSEDHALLSLNKMIDGGIYDQIGGGLCRYSTDAEWLAPHFEKMLYDNALFIITLANAALLTKKDKYKETIVQTCEFLFREMKNAEGGYYAALDADSEGVEGKFYVWDIEETREILGDDAEIFNAYYDVTEAGNWEHRNILRVLQPMSEFASLKNIPENELRDTLKNCAEKLMVARSKRIRPGTDDKIILGWNSLLVTAFCKAYALTQNEKYLNEAVSLTNFLLRVFDDGHGGLHHTYKNGAAKYPGFLDDYTYLADALIHLQEITADERYLHLAKKYTDYAFEHFSDTESEFFFYTRAQQRDIVVRKIELYDGATPSANGVMAKNLLYLSLVFDEREKYYKGVSMIFSLKDIILKHPGSFGIWAAAAMNLAAGINEIAIIGSDMMPRLCEVLLHYIPNKILQGSEKESDMPLMKEKGYFEKTSLYLCRNYSCNNPVEATDELVSSVRNSMF